MRGSGRCSRPSGMPKARKDRPGTERGASRTAYSREGAKARTPPGFLSPGRRASRSSRLRVWPEKCKAGSPLQGGVVHQRCHSRILWIGRLFPGGRGSGSQRRRHAPRKRAVRFFTAQEGAVNPLLRREEDDGRRPQLISIRCPTVARQAAACNRIGAG